MIANEAWNFSNAWQNYFFSQFSEYFPALYSTMESKLLGNPKCFHMGLCHLITGFPPHYDWRNKENGHWLLRLFQEVTLMASDHIHGSTLVTWFLRARKSTLPLYSRDRRGNGIWWTEVHLSRSYRNC